MEITFFGVRGSCPCAGEEYRRFGGNTSCLLVTVRGDDPLILDLGTGARALGQALERTGLADGRPLRATALLTHLHYDHILGLPFFRPIQNPGAVLDVYGPRQGEEPLAELLPRAVEPPFFPVQLAELRGSVRFHDVLDDHLAIGSAKVTVRPVAHIGATVGFRIEADSGVLAYIPDHQAPEDRQWVDPAVLELCDGADVVVHDAQYTEPEFPDHVDWGHSTVAYAVHVAAVAGARQLVLFHHDPSHADREIEELAARAVALPEATHLRAVFAAAEGATLAVGGG